MFTVLNSIIIIIIIIITMIHRPLFRDRSFLCVFKNCVKKKESGQLMKRDKTGTFSLNVQPHVYSVL